MLDQVFVSLVDIPYIKDEDPVIVFCLAIGNSNLLSRLFPRLQGM